MLPKEVFLSHSDKDRQFATSLARILRRHNIPVWYSRSSLVGAQQWHDEIGAALNRCNWFLLVLTPDSVKSEWVKHELMFALNNRRYRGKIVPLLLKPCKYTKLSWTLSEFQTVDFTQRKQSDGYRALLKIWGISYKPK
jgi:TIR domain